MPVTQTTRRVPLVLMKLLKQELHLMDDMEIITRMTVFRLDQSASISQK